jgi:pathogenesis-related protein 1
MRQATGLLILLAGMMHGQTLEDAMLAAHNSIRRSVGVPPLVWSKRLAGFAQEWADYLAAHHQFVHRRNSPYGENLFEITGATASPSEVVNDWAAESKSYQYRSNTCGGVCGHYTQIVWRDTKRVGCAASRRGRTEVWVCNYDPPGNYIGKRPY